MEKPLEKPAAKGLRLPAKATVYYIMSSALAKSIGLISTPIFTRLLTGEEYGSYTLYMSVLGIFSLIASSAVSPTVIYRGLEKFRDEKECFILSALCSGFCFCGVICIFLFTFSSLLGLDSELTLLLSLQIFCDVLLNLYQSEKRYDYDFRALSLTNALSVILSPALAVILVVGGVGYRGRIYALLAVSLGLSFVQLAKFIRKAGARIKKGCFSYVTKRTLPLLPHSLSTALSSQTDKLLLSALLGASALAKYSVAHTLGLSLGFAATAVSSSLYPWVMRKLSRGECRAVQPVLRGILLSLSALAVAVAILLPELFLFLAPRSYADASFAVFPLLLSTLPTFATAFISAGIVQAERGGYTSYSAAVSLLSGIILNLILIPRFEYIGAGLSLLISSLIALPINYGFLKKCGRGEIFSPISFIKIFLAALLGVLLAGLFRECAALRILLFTLPSTMLLFAYSEVRELIME